MQQLMYKVRAHIHHKPHSDVGIVFEVIEGTGEPFKETEKQFMVGDGRYKQRVSKDDYLSVKHDFGQDPAYQQYFIWARTDDLKDARRMLKGHIMNRYQQMRDDVVAACHAIATYDPGAHNA